MEKFLRINNSLYVIFTIILFSFALQNCGTTNQSTKSQSIKIEDLKSGNGKEAVDGSKITVHYVGTLTNGTKFDSSRDKNRPFTFVLGDGVVIEGWDIGLQGMKVGGLRKLTIAPELGYGNEDHNKIPANSTLVFEIELLNVE